MTLVDQPIVNVLKTEDPQVGLEDQRVLIVGQQTGSTYTDGQLVEDIGNGGTEFSNMGKGSHVSEMVRRFRQINTVSKLDAIVLDDAGAAVPAIKTIAFSGPASEDGTITVYVGSRVDHKYTISVSDTDTATVIGDALVTAIGNDDFAIVTAVNTTGSVALTAINGGTVGNDTGIQVIDLPAGVTSTVTNTTPGATDPTLTTLFDVVGDKRYQTVVYPHNYDITVLADQFSSASTFLDPRWNADNDILDGVGVITKSDTLGNLKTFLNARNSQSLVVNCTETVSETNYKGSSTFELSDIQSSEIGALRSLRLTDGANISSIVNASGLDARGGAALSSLPYHNTPTSFPVIDGNKGFTPSEVDELNEAGGFVCGDNKSNTVVLIGKVVTTRKTDSAGNTAPTYKFLNKVDQASIGAEYMFNQSKAVFSQTRLTDGAVFAGRNIQNKNTLRSQFVEWFNVLSGIDFLVYRAGDANAKLFADSLVITLDLGNGEVSSRADVPLVSQLRELDITLRQLID